jgi:hypothetical protein
VIGFCSGILFSTGFTSVEGVGLVVTVVLVFGERNKFESINSALFSEGAIAWL